MGSYKSGFCGTLEHSGCAPFYENGARAATRYGVCACSCHKDDQKLIALALSATAHWGVADDSNIATTDELHRHLDTVNAVLAAGRKDDTR